MLEGVPLRKGTLFFMGRHHQDPAVKGPLLLSWKQGPLSYALKGRAVRVTKIYAKRSELDWMKRGACVGADPAMTAAFTDGATSMEDAKPLVWALCAGCPVQQACRQWAINEKNFAGIAGGCLFKSTGNGSDYTSGVPVHVPRPPGTLTGWNSKVHPKIRTRHWVRSIGDRGWIALCGARCTPTKNTNEQTEMDNAPKCPQCERTKINDASRAA